MRNLITRSISGFVYIFIFLFAILFSSKSYIILTGFFALVCLWEFSKIIQFKNKISYILLPVSIYYFLEYSSKKQLFILLIITLICFIKLIFHLYSINKKYPTTFLQKLDVCIRYIILPFSFLISLPFINNNYQPYIIIYSLLLIWVNDSFAYLIGKNFGKHKLFEKISPKKTIEGFIGGWIFSLITASIIGYYSNNFGILNWIIIASIFSVFGTIGDLIESKFKRQANIKDSGTIMPGHGGLLDRLDSLFFAIPFVYLYVHYLL